MADETINVEVNSNIGDVAKDTKKATGELGFFKKGIKGIGTAIKAAGIGLLVGLFAKLFETLSKNQKVVDAFSTAMNFLNIAFSDLFNFIGDNINTVIDYFKNIFEDPLGSLEDFATAIKDNLIERLNSFIETLGFLASALVKVFKGDFKGALKDVKEAGTEFVDVLTGVDDSADKITKTVKKVTAGIVKYTKSTYKAAEAQTALDKAVNKSASSLEKLNIEFEKQASAQQRIIDNERNSFADRKAALEELTRLTEENNAANVKAQELLVKQAQAQFDLNGSDENAIALQIEKNKLASIEAANFNKLIGLSDKDRDITEKNTQAKLSAFSSLAGSLSSLAGDNKELAAAGAIIDTYAGANKAFAQGGVAGFATGAAIVAAGLANLQKIYATPTGEGGGGGGGTITAAAATPAPQMMSGAFELSGGTEPEAFKAYVVTDEMTNSQNQLANIRRRATI
jgi:hypothetical protein